MTSEFPTITDQLDTYASRGFENADLLVAAICLCVLGWAVLASIVVGLL